MPIGLFACIALSIALKSNLLTGEVLDVAASVIYYILAFGLCVASVSGLWGLDPLSSLVISTLGYCIQHVGSDLANIVIPFLPEAVSNDHLAFYAVHTFVIVIAALLVYALTGRRFRIDVAVVSRRVAWVVACAAAVLFLIVFSMVFADGQKGETRRVCFAYDALATAFLMASLMLLVRVDGLRAELATSEALWRRRGEQYELTRESIDLINEKCHDIRKRVADLRSPALSETSLAQIQDSIRVYDAGARTGNDALDVVLTSKSLVCAQNGIDLTCMADGASLSFVPDDELYSLIENVLDNAIEAAVGLADAERRSISLTVRREGDFVAIREDNYFDGKLSWAGDGLPRTTKKDQANHGFGLRSVRRFVGDHEGEMRLRAEDGVFSLAILLPVPEG